jgi:hypothetical protein
MLTPLSRSLVASWHVIRRYRALSLVLAALWALEGGAHADEPKKDPPKKDPPKKDEPTKQDPKRILEDGTDPDRLPDESGALRRDPRASAEARAVARQFLRANRFAEAKVEVDRAVLLADTAAERAAVSELAFVLEEWAMHGPPKRRVTCKPLSVSANGELARWQRHVSEARALLIEGCFSAAEETFEELFATAPDLVAASRVMELRALARESEAEAILPKKRDVPTALPVSSDATSAENQKPGVVKRWYGWQTLILDGVALVLTPINPYVGLGTYLLGAPIVHGAHGRFLTGFGDLGLRFSAPVVGAALPYIASTAGKNGGCKTSCEVATATGAVLGLVAAVVIDAAAIAREEIPKRESARMNLRPIAVPHPTGLDLGLIATF